MKQLQEISKDIETMDTIVDLTGVFESLASMRIAQIKNQVQQSQAFFEQLWRIYSQIRVDRLFRFGRGEVGAKVSDKELFIAITAEGGFSGDIDQRLIDLLKKSNDPKKNDIIVIGHHGAVQLAQDGVSFKKYYKLPAKDQNINVVPIVQEVQGYRTTTVFYQKYQSLYAQEVKKIELSKAVEDEGKKVQAGDTLITESTYIFEPSTYAVVDHLERTMTQIALAQVILESKLAQYASRFQAMSLAHSRADDSLGELKLFFSRTKRSIKDERLKEIMNGLRKSEVRI